MSAEGKQGYEYLRAGRQVCRWTEYSQDQAMSIAIDVSFESLSLCWKDNQEEGYPAFLQDGELCTDKYRL